MKEEYGHRLESLRSSLTEIVLDEADPANWPGAGKPIAGHTKQERGDRYWHKKNAAASLTLLIKIHSLRALQAHTSLPPDGSNPDDAAFLLGQKVSEAERQAAAIIERLQKGK